MIADQSAPKKQRHTARRIWQRLIAEHDDVLAGEGGAAAALDRVQLLAAEGACAGSPA